MLTHLSKTNAFCRRPSVISKSILFVDSQHPLSPYSMLQYASWTLWPGYNIEKGRGGRNVKIRHGKTHAFNETGLFRGVSQLLLSMIVGISICSIYTLSNSTSSYKTVVYMYFSEAALHRKGRGGGLPWKGWSNDVLARPNWSCLEVEFKFSKELLHSSSRLGLLHYIGTLYMNSY